MIRPPGSSPPSFQRARSGVGVLSGFEAFAFGSHHFVGALSDRNWPVVVLAAPRHQHEDDARDLVGERDRGQRELVLTVLRSSIPLAHRRRASLCLCDGGAWHAQAPTTSSLRR
jgi:hypothetical protein